MLLHIFLIGDLNFKNMIKNNLQSGFTLVEILVAAFIFGSVVTIAASIFGLSSNVQISTEIMRDTAQQGRFALEQITRDIRISDSGFSFCGSEMDTDCNLLATKSNFIRIHNSNGDKIYGLSILNNILQEKTFDKVKDTWSDWQPLISSNFSIEAVDETIFSGNLPSVESIEQPSITIKFKIINNNVRKESEKSILMLETSVTSRAYNVVGSWKSD